MFTKDMKVLDYIDLFTNVLTEECLTKENSNYLHL